jgi:hypothetical protein
MLNAEVDRIWRMVSREMVDDHESYAILIQQVHLHRMPERARA